MLGGPAALERLPEAGQIELVSLTEEEMDSIGADEDTPFRPAEPSERLRSLSDEARRAVRTAAVRGLIARGLIRMPSAEQLAAAPAEGRLDVAALGDLDLILKARRGPVSVTFVAQTDYLAALHEFLDPAERTAFLEERIDREGFHHFRLRSPEDAVEALARLADPDDRGAQGPPPGVTAGSEIPDDVAEALRELSAGVTRLEGFHNRAEGTRKVQLSSLARPDGVRLASSAFGVAPEPPRLFPVDHEGLRGFIRSALLDQPHPASSADPIPEQDPTPSGYRCPVCGWPKLDEPARTAESGASYEICPSCGFQFGFSDEALGRTYEDWRREWVEAGMPWHSRGIRRPWGWNPKAQLDALLRDLS